MKRYKAPEIAYISSTVASWIMNEKPIHGLGELIFNNFVAPAIKEINKASEPKNIVKQLSKLTDEERLEVFSKFCVHCGSLDPKCFCMGDD